MKEEGSKIAVVTAGAAELGPVRLANWLLMAFKSPCCRHLAKARLWPRSLAELVSLVRTNRRMICRC